MYPKKLDESVKSLLHEADETKNSNLDVSEALNNLGEVSYLQKLEVKGEESCVEFIGHDTKWFEQSNNEASKLTINDGKNDTVNPTPDETFADHSIFNIDQSKVNIA